MFIGLQRLAPSGTTVPGGATVPSVARAPLDACKMGQGSHTVHSPGRRANASVWAPSMSVPPPPTFGSCQLLARSLSIARGCAWRCACGPGLVVALGRVPDGTACARASACTWCVCGAGHASPVAGPRVGLQSCVRTVLHSLPGCEVSAIDVAWPLGAMAVPVRRGCRARWERVVVGSRGCGPGPAGLGRVMLPPPLTWSPSGSG